MRFVKIAVRSMMLAFLPLLFLSLSAEAGPLGGRNVREGGRPAGNPSAMAPRAMDRPPLPRGHAGEERMQRLSAEERQQLRRDIRDAGREIYRPRR